MSESRVLADTGGLVVTDDGRRVVVIDRRTGGLAVTAFVLGIVTLIVSGFGAVALFTMSAMLGAGFLAAGIVAGVGAAMVIRTFRRRRAQPLHDCRPVATLDRKLGLFSYPGSPILALEQVRFERRTQFGSSSPMLVAVLPNGTRVIKRGNPFDGGIGNVDEVLTAAVAGASSQP